MKKFNLGKLKLASDEVLQRNQMSNIYGGSGSGGSSDNCCVHMREAGTNAYIGSTCGHSYMDAVGWYHMGSHTQDGSQWVSGYCCTSCT